jgi:intergrase/recombinase
VNWFRGHKKCYFTILPTAVWDQFRQVRSFDSVEIEIAHKLTKKVADVMFVGLRKLHYNVMSRVMDMNEAQDIYWQDVRSQFRQDTMHCTSLTGWLADDYVQAWTKFGVELF